MTDAQQRCFMLLIRAVGNVITVMIALLGMALTSGGWLFFFIFIGVTEFSSLISKLKKIINTDDEFLKT